MTVWERKAKPLVEVPYYPGCLLREYSSLLKGRHPILQGLFLIISMDEFDVKAISLYDKDGYFNINESVGISHEDLHTKSYSFLWVIQEP